jgi:uncharacterized membrane protein
MEFLANHHPQVVHFPIVLFISYFVFELFGVLLKKEYLHTAAYIILIGGVVTSMMAVLTGNQAQTVAEALLNKENSYLKDLINNHQIMATITVWYFFAMLVLRTYLIVKEKFSVKMKYALIVLGLIGTCLVYATGNIGGSLVFKHGIGTQLFGK